MSLSLNLDYPNVEVKKGDFISAMLRIENSYDTTKSLTVSMDALRLVCTNGMTIGSRLFQSSTKHIGSETSHSVVKEMVHQVLDNGQERFLEMNETFRMMSESKVTKDRKDQFIKSLGKYPNYVIDKVVGQIIETKPKNVWDLYNCITYVASHEMDRDKLSTLNTEESLNKDVLALLN